MKEKRNIKVEGKSDRKEEIKETESVGPTPVPRITTGHWRALLNPALAPN